MTTGSLDYDLLVSLLYRHGKPFTINDTDDHKGQNIMLYE
jgi:hypothetical protein